MWKKMYCFTVAYRLNTTPPITPAKFFFNRVIFNRSKKP